MPIHASFSQVGILYTIFAPFIIIFSILISSAISGQPIVGLIYLVGIFVTTVILWPPIAYFIGQKIDFDFAKPGLCSMFNYPINDSIYVSPAFNTMIYAFTIAFMSFPQFSGQGLPPPPLAAGNPIYFLLIFTMLINLYVRGRVLCCLPQTAGAAFAAITSGIVIGVLSGGLFSQLSIFGGGSGNGWQFASFTGDASNKLACQKPQPGQGYKCQVFKNGTPVGAL